VNCDDGRETELSSSPISIMASPDNVASVSVGEVGECGDFSSVRVSPVIVRARDITTVGLTRRENGGKCQKLLRNCEIPVRSIAELWLNDLWRVNRLCTHCWARCEGLPRSEASAPTPELRPQLVTVYENRQQQKTSGEDSATGNRRCRC
jgi:hypothetical protein